MRDPEERTRHFVVRGKKEQYYDEPAAGRRKKMLENEEEQRYFSKAEGSERPGRRFIFSSRSRDDIDTEDEAPRVKTGNTRAQYDEEIDYYDDEERKRAPFLVRVFAWIALIAVLFAVGYIGANYFFSWIDKKGASKAGVVYAPDSAAGQSQQGAAVSGIAGSVAYTIYIPDKNGKFIERSIDIDKGLPEEDIAKVLAVYIDGLKEINLMDNGVAVQNVFCSGDWLYLDMTRAFESSIKRIGKDKAAFVITGLVKTMQENFPPIKKVKFYIEGRESSDKSAADLSKPWEITQ